MSNKININNPELAYYWFQLFNYAVIIYFGTKMYLINNKDIFSIKYGVFLLVVYCLSCFWTNKMLLYDDKIEIIYPTRIFCRKYTLSYNMITKVIFTDRGRAGARFIIYIKKSYFHHSIISGKIDDIKRTIQYFRDKGVELEYKLIDPKDIKKYTND